MCIRKLLFAVHTKICCAIWFVSDDSAVLLSVYLKCEMSWKSHLVLYLVLCFFLLVVIALLLAQWLSSLGTKYRTFTLLMWTTLLSRIGR